MVDNITPNQLPITYEKSSAPSQVMNDDNIIKTDLASFNCKVGPISNISTNFKAMMPLVEDYQPYRDTLTKRIKLLRRYIGDSIDSAKGIEMKNIPKTWTKKNKIYENDSESIKRSKSAKNKIVAYRKPYFMIDLYETLENEYKSYKTEKNIHCKMNYRCNLQELQKKANKTKEEKQFIKEYYDDMPVLASKCVMNELSWYIENWEKENIVFKNKFEDCTDLMVDSSIPENKERLKKVRELYNEFMKRERDLINSKKKDELDIESTKTINMFYDEMREKANVICNNAQEFANYAVKICYETDVPEDKKKLSKKHKRFVWCIAKDGLLKNIELHKQDKIEVPILDKNGTEYLGKRYSLKEVKNTKEEV